MLFPKPPLPLVALLLLAPLGEAASAQQVKLLASDGASLDRFGQAVSLDGAWALVGAPGKSPDGAIYFFRNNAGVWTQHSKVVPAGLEPGEQAGSKVCLNGTLAVTGAPGPPFGSQRGSAYVFRFNGTAWVQEQKVFPPAPTTVETFGRTVAIQGDDLLVGAFDAAKGKGKVFVFHFDGTAWVLTQKITPPAVTHPELFGFALAMDSGWAVVGATDDLARGEEVYFYRRTPAGAWKFVQTASPFDPTNQHDSDAFGLTLALRDPIAGIGASRHEHFGGLASTGAVYVFRRQGKTWTGEQEVLPDDLKGGDAFGSAVAVDGDSVLGTRPLNPTASGSGTATLFLHHGIIWSSAMRIEPFDPAFSDRFGFSAALREGTALIGNPTGTNGATDSGAAYVTVLPRVNTISLTGPVSVGAGTSPVWTWSGAPVNAPYSFLMSGNTKGSFFQGHPIDVGPGVKVLATGTTTASGDGSFTIRVPGKFRGKTGSIEVAVVSGGTVFDSNPITVTVF